MNKMKLLLLTTFLLFTSCTIIPTYRMTKREFCERTYYDKICPGTDQDYNYYPNAGRGIYD